MMLSQPWGFSQVGDGGEAFSTPAHVRKRVPKFAPRLHLASRICCAHQHCGLLPSKKTGEVIFRDLPQPRINHLTTQRTAPISTRDAHAIRLLQMEAKSCLSSLANQLWFNQGIFCRLRYSSFSNRLPNHLSSAADKAKEPCHRSDIHQQEVIGNG